MTIERAVSANCSRRKNAGTITAAEESDLHKYLRVGQFLDLMQAKARLSLKSPASP
jgi:hypothetical protein